MTLRTDRRGCVQCGETLTDLAEALGRVRAEDGAPYVMTWDEVLEAVRDLREDRDDTERERDEALRRLAEHEWYARATCEEPRACGECAGCAEWRRRAEADTFEPPWEREEGDDG